MPSHFQENIVREAGELHGLELAGIKPELIDLGQFEDRIVVDIDLNQTCDGAPSIEGLIAAAEDFESVDAIRVGKSALASLGHLRNLGRANAQRFELLDRVVTHSSSIKGLRINRVEDVASGERKAKGHQEWPQDKPQESVPGGIMGLFETASHAPIVRGAAQPRSRVSRKY